jgi:hypothetical protein
MRNLIVLLVRVSILSIVFMPVNSIAKTKQHYIGHGYHYEGELDTCRYWITDDKKRKSFSMNYMRQGMHI